MVDRITPRTQLVEGGLATAVFFRVLQALTDFLEKPYAPSTALANLPTSAKEGAVRFCPNEAGGPTLVFWDGVANWRRVQDRAIAS